MLYVDVNMLRITFLTFLMICDKTISFNLGHSTMLTLANSGNVAISFKHNDSK